MFNDRIIVKINRVFKSIKRILTNFPGRLPLNLQSTNYPGLSGLSSPNHGFDNNTGSNNQRENQQHQQHQQPSGGLLAAVSGQPGQGQLPPPHLAGLHARMLELGQNSGGPGAPPSIHAPPPSNGFPTSAMNMNMKPDNNSPSSSSESPVPPSKLITTSAGIPFQPHNLGSYHHSPMKSESDRGAGMCH